MLKTFPFVQFVTSRIEDPGTATNLGQRISEARKLFKGESSTKALARSQNKVVL